MTRLFILLLLGPALAFAEIRPHLVVILVDDIPADLGATYRPPSQR